jgi:hypothetical protein
MEIRERLARADPANAGWQRDLSVSHNNIGDILRAQGDLAEALKAFGAGMEIAEHLARADPGNAGWQRGLVVSHTKLYAAASAGSQATLARWHLAHCVRVLHSMQRSGMYLDAGLSGLLSQLEAAGIKEEAASASKPPTLNTPTAGQQAAGVPPPAAPRGSAGQVPRVGRNEACPCGSGKKYKDCHGRLA